MPKRIYTVERVLSERRQWAQRHSGVLVPALRTRTPGKRFRPFPEAAVFDFLQAKLERQPIGTRATFAGERRGRKVGSVYEKGAKHYFLVERIFYGPDGKETRRQQFSAPRTTSQIKKARKQQG